MLERKKKGISYAFLIEFFNYKELNLLTTKARVKRLESPYSFSVNNRLNKLKNFDSKDKRSNFFEKFQKNNICFFILQYHFLFLFGNVSVFFVSKRNKQFWLANLSKRKKETSIFQKQKIEKNLGLLKSKPFPVFAGETGFSPFINFSSFNLLFLRKYFDFCLNKKNFSFDSFNYYSSSYSSIKFCLKPKFFILVQKVTEYSLLNSEKYKKNLIRLSMKNSSINGFQLDLQDSMLSGKQSFTVSKIEEI